MVLSLHMAVECISRGYGLLGACSGRTRESGRRTEVAAPVVSGVLFTDWCALQRVQLDELERKYNQLEEDQRAPGEPSKLEELQAPPCDCACRRGGCSLCCPEHMGMLILSGLDCV